ncbi:MAG: TonB-dependent receptor plug domain-containing protein [Bacteroidales bacterium]|nr:TonB-dependent receptor plug domain-containing protein [Bacteroidales bacterium]MDD3430736.1 TonB-dependent receptor plug domain-containing protein [Bacteroidales bacterium]
MKKIIILPVLCCMLINLSSFAQENQPVQTAAEDKAIEYITAQLRAFPQEKVYLHHDKPYYSAGDTIWFRAYMVHATLHQPMAYSRYIYVELINESKLVVSRIKIRPEEGLYYSQMPIKADIAPGKYYLRAYTNYMRNLEEDYFFHKEIYIGNLITPEAEINLSEASSPVQAVATNKGQSPQENNQQYNVQFFPEGGHLISGNMQTIAFKAIDQEGWGTDIHGRILKNGKDEICTFKSSHLGMGYFGIYTEPDCFYTAECENEAGRILSIDLPQPTDSCYSLSVNQLPNKIHISIITPYGNPLQEELSVLVHMRGLPLFKSKVSAGTNLLSLPKTVLSSGVLHIVLLNAEAEVLSERLVFIKGNDRAGAEITFDKSTYGPREAARAELQITNSLGQGFQGSFSLSITDDNLIDNDSNTLSIESYLLLCSELKGYIEQPQAYFLAENKAAASQLDILMMTQGWRRYNIPRLIKGELDQANRFEMEIGSTMCGKIQTYPFRRGLPNVNVFCLNSKHGYYNATVTDIGGRFCFDGFEFPDSSVFFVQAEKKPGNVIELVAENEDFPPAIVYGLKPKTALQDETIENFLSSSRDRYFYENGPLVINLEEVQVIGKKDDRAKNLREERGALYFSSSYTIEAQEIEEMGGATLLDVLIRVPGITLNADNTGVLLRNASPLIQVDNFRGRMEDLSIINLSEVEMIDVLKDPAETALYGNEGQNGVICIYLKRGGRNAPRELGSHQKLITFMGYTPPVEYYQPKYFVSSVKESTKPDLRSTIYWKPNLITDENGQAEIRFYTADLAGTYTLILEGISPEGEILRHVQKIELR